MKTENAESSPVKMLVDEIEVFRKLFRATQEAHAARMEKELGSVLEKAGTLGDPEALPNSKIRDIRDMLTLLRNADVKPEKGRRKDLKKMESIASDLMMLVEKW